MQAQPPSGPVIVRIIETPSTGLTDVLISALGVTGVIVLLALLLGLGFAAVLFWLRSRNA